MPATPAPLGQHQLGGPAETVGVTKMHLDAVLGPEPTPELAAQIADECRRLLGLLRDESLRSVALWKMEGYTHEEIAARLGCVRFTVDRKLRAIRQIWDEERGP